MWWRPWLQVAVGALAGSPLAQLLLQCSTSVVHFVPACHTPILVCFLDFQPSSPSYNYFEIFAPASPGRRAGSRCCGTPWRGMNSHISCSALQPPLTAKPRAKPPVDPRPNLNQSLQGNWENIGSCIMGEEEEEGEEVKQASYFESSNIQKTLQDLILLTRKSNLKLDLFFGASLK